MRSLRRARGMTLTELSLRTGIDKSLLSMAERGQKRFDADQLARIGRVLKANPDDLFRPAVIRVEVA